MGGIKKAINVAGTAGNNKGKTPIRSGKKCRVEGCNKPATDNAHISGGKSNSKLYLAHLCHEHNMATGVFKLKERATNCVGNVTKTQHRKTNARRAKKPKTGKKSSK